MSDGEIIKELKFIEEVIGSRYSGYWKKFAKKLKSKVYKHKDVLGVGEYKINENKVLICFQKIVTTDELPYLWITHIVITEDNGAFLSFKNQYEHFAFHHFTNHAIERMWQRMGLTVKDFFINEYVIKADTTHHLTKYDEYGYDDSTYIMSIGRCFFIVGIDGDKIIVKTALDSDNIYENQMMLYSDSKICAEKYADRMYERDVDRIKGFGVKKVSNAIRAMFA
jgi:hypothetical protein